MFCTKCGKQLNDGASFCDGCGASQNSSISTMNATSTMTVEDEKSILIERMNGSFDVMTSIRNQELLIDNYETKIEKHTKLSKKRWVCVFFFVTFLICYGINIQSDALASFLLLAGIVLGIIFISSHRKKVKSFQKKIIESEGLIENLKTDASISWLPYDYRDSTSFAYIFQYIKNLRAHTLTEAIKLYETEKHQARLEAMSALMAMAAQDAASSANAAAGAFFSLFK